MERAELAERLGAARPTPGTRDRAPTVVREAAPAAFRSSLAAAIAGEGNVFLGDPAWGAREREQLQALQQVDRGRPDPALGWLMIPTGGTSGGLKFARHDGRTLAAAVDGFRRHFEVERVNAIGLLPLHHVSGLMAWLRCALSGGEYVPADWKRIEAGERPVLAARHDGWGISLVPTQLERLLRDAAAVDWLRGFRFVFVGGAATAPGLLDRAADRGLRLAPGYGMTETAAMVTALRPEEFLAGARSSGRPLPHARVAVGADGRVVIGGDSLFRGYFPAWRGEPGYVTTDLGRIDDRGHLHLLGRADAVIVSGGEKVNPAEVEMVLRETGEFDDVVVLGRPDVEWGEVVTAVYAGGRRPDLDRVEERVAGRLAAYKRPKHYVALSGWPVTAAGKVDRAEVRRRVGLG